MKGLGMFVLAVLITLPGFAQIAQKPQVPTSVKPVAPIAIKCELPNVLVNGVCVQTGGQAQPCVPPNNTCNTGLNCSPEKTCVAQGAKGQPCFSNETCLQTLACGTNKACDETGTLNHPCKGGTCNTGMVCKSTTFSGPQMCYAAGGDLQPCLANGTCNTGFLCYGGGGAGNTGTCLAAGAQGQFCLANNVCNSGLRCFGGSCVPAGAQGQFCLPNNVCNGELLCLGNCQKPPVIATLTVPGQIKAGQSATGTITLQEAMQACNTVQTCVPGGNPAVVCGTYGCAPAPGTITKTCVQTADPGCSAVAGYEVKLQMGLLGGALPPSVTMPAQVIVKRGTTSVTFPITVGLFSGGQGVNSMFLVVASPVGGTAKLSNPIAVVP